MQTPIVSLQKSPHEQVAIRSLIWAAIISVGLWFVPAADIVLYPIRLFVTFVHEGGHALMTFLTGGHVLSITLDATASGVTLSQGGSIGLVYMAGYLGTTAFGAGCLLLARSSYGGKAGLGLLASVVLLVAGLWCRPFGDGFFGFATGVGIGVLLAICAAKLKERAAFNLFCFLAVQLCLNAVFDLRTLLFLTTSTNIPNDAVFMAQAFGLTPWFWAGTWAILSIGILAASLRALMKSVKN